jgi:arsenite methyltransferase
MTASDRLAAAGVDVDAVVRHAALAKQAIADELIGYRMLVAEKPRNLSCKDTRHG